MVGSYHVGQGAACWRDAAFSLGSGFGKKIGAIDPIVVHISV